MCTILMVHLLVAISVIVVLTENKVQVIHDAIKNLSKRRKKNYIAL